MLKKVLAVVLALFLLVYIAALLVPVDPLEQRPGLRLSGEVVETADPDWSGLAPRELIYVQTQPWYGIPHSVTTTTFVVDGELYIPCARCPTKQWPRNVASDPQVVVKVQGKLYRRRAVQITDTAFLARVFSNPEAQDGAHPPEDVFLYHLTNP